MLAGGSLVSGAGTRRVLWLMLGMVVLGLAGTVALAAGMSLVKVTWLGPAPAQLAMLAIGLSQGGVAACWTMIEEHTSVAAHHAFLNGIMNTVAIGMDAVMQMVFGALLDMHWGGEMDSKGNRIYSASSYCFAFVLMPVLYGISCLSCGHCMYLEFTTRGAGATAGDVVRGGRGGVR